MDAAFATDAGVLGAAERGAQIAKEPRVHPHDAGFEFGRYAVRSGQIAGPNGGRQSVVRRVGPIDDLVLRIEREDMTARAEDFLRANRSVVREPGPDRWLDPGALGEVAGHLRNAAAGHDRGSGFHGLCIVRKHLLPVLQRDQRTHAGRGIAWRSDAKTLNGCLQG